MSEQRNQQGVEGKVRREVVLGICLAPNCDKEVIKKYKSLRVCGEDCWNRYLAEEARKRQVESYSADVPPQVRAKLHQHNMGRGFPSIEHFERAYS